MNTQLLCLFTYRNELDTSLEFVLRNYTLINPNIFDLLFEKIGLNIKRDHRYIWSANHCPIK